MGKRKRTLARPPQRMTKRERSRWQRERRIQRNLIIIFVAIGVVSVLVLAYGLYQEHVADPGQVIARVNGEPIHKRDYWGARRLQLIADVEQQLTSRQISEQMGITLTEQQQVAFQESLRSVLLELGTVRRETALDEQVIQGLIEDETLVQGARALGIDPSDEEVIAWLVPDTASETASFTTPLTGTQATPTPVSTLSPQERERYQVEEWTLEYDFLARLMEEFKAGNLGFSLSDFVAMRRGSARVALLRQRVQERLAEDLPKEEEQVLVSHILIQERYSRAQQAKLALDGGDSFAKVVVEYSDDRASRDKAGDLGWLTQGEGRPSPAVEAAAFAITQTGGLSPVVVDEAGYHILQLVERSDDGTQAHVRHILLPADRRAEAEEVLALLEEGGLPFDQLVTAYSEDTATASSGGDLGWLTRGEGLPSPEVEEAAFALTTTTPLSGLVEDEAGYHILQLVERSEDGTQVHVRHVLIRDGEGHAQEVLDLLSQGTDFAEAVVEHSIDQETVDLAGDVGWVRAGDGTLPAKVEEAAFAITETGRFSPIVEEEAGWYIVQLAAQDEAGGRIRLRQVLVKRAERLAAEIQSYVEEVPEERSARFLEMALLYSDEWASRDAGGDLGWFGRGRYPEIEEEAFSAEPGEIRLFEGGSGYHILWVRERDPSHPIDEETLDQRASQALEQWLQDLLDAAVIERYPPPTPTPTQPPPSPPPMTTQPITATATP